MDVRDVLLDSAEVVALPAAIWFGMADVVQWTAPASCPDDAAVEARIAALVEVSEAIAPTQAIVTEREGGFEVELVSTIEGETQRRTLTAPTCETVADAAAAVIAVTIDPVAADPPSEVVPPVEVAPATVVPKTAPTTTTATRPADREPVPRTPNERRPLEIGLHLGGGYGSAIAPRGSGVLGAGLSVGRRPWSLEAEGRVWTPRTFEADSETFGARVFMATAMLVGCLRPPSDRVEVPLCLGVEGGAERVSPTRLVDGRVAVYPWFAPLLRVGVRVRVNALLGVILRAEAAVPGLRAAINIEGFGQLWQTQAVSARVLAGLDFRWIR